MDFNQLILINGRAVLSHPTGKPGGDDLFSVIVTPSGAPANDGLKR
jgi:hypothetical protein